MSELLFIEEETLTSIGDAIRSKTGKTHTTTLNLDKAFEVVSVGSANQPCYKVPTSVFNGYRKVVLDWQAERGAQHNASYAVAGELIDGGYRVLYGAYAHGSIFADFTQDITVAFDKLYNPEQGYKTDYVYIFKFDSHIINYLVITARNIYKPSEMVDEINNFNIIPPEAFIWSGNCSFKGSAQYGYGWFMDSFKDKIITRDVQNASNMFNGYKGEEIPFEINFTTSNNSVITNMFQSCENLTTLPPMNNVKIGSTSHTYVFAYCYRLREIPEDWAGNFDWSVFHNGSYSCNYWFYGCSSLRKIPQNLITNIWCKPNSTSISYYPYSSQYTSCHCLDELENIPVIFHSSGNTSNLFSYAFNHCSRLKKLTFQPVEGVKWKSQTIEVNNYVGYASSESYITGYNSGLTTATQITDQASYEALKNNPDNWTTMVEYSRYNHDSAVETINSLPDTYAYGTNTIKFKGASGSLTDGGAISTLTPEEIAVATAKGWTVSLI